VREKKKERQKFTIQCVLLVWTAGMLFLLCSPLTNSFTTVRVAITVQGNGRVEQSPEDTVVLTGSRVRFTAVPDTGFFFTGWNGSGIPFTAANPLEIAVRYDVTITAVFERLPRGLAFVNAKDSSFRMGSTSAAAQEYESPVQAVRFGHDFFIGRCEVTQKEYLTFAARMPEIGAGIGGMGDSLPVYNVTWYDAVLYCNQRSKAEGYDTVYSYAGICQDASCAWVLENLKIHYDRFGYRLPTEAEWEYACRAGMKTDYYWGNAADSAVSAAWFYVNSSGRSQSVGRLLPNAFGLYDMAGNVAEWVNDWLVHYAGSAVTDPAGPAELTQEQYEATGERPLRGGSWQLGTAFLRSSSRRGPYRTSAFALAKDIGFRVALGSFTPGNSMQPSEPQNPLSITLACSRTDLHDFIGASGVKIAFVTNQNGRCNLVFLDCSLPENLQVHPCGRDASVFGVSISPDGRYAAYSSQGEGFSGPCTLTVRRLDTLSSSPVTATGAFLPHFWVDPSSKDTFMIFSDGASMNSTLHWHTETTYRQQWSGGDLVGTPLELWAPGSYHGGLSSDGRFLGTSYPVARLVDLQVPDTNNFLFLSPDNGRDDPPGTKPQVCNLQMSPSLSEPGECLLLDFGYPRVSTLVGKPYGMHQVIFILTMRYATPQYIPQWFEKPMGYDQWDFPRWSNFNGFAVAIARPGAGNEDAVYLINRRDSTYLKVATGKNLSYPALWIDPSEVSEVDDPYRYFGAYDIPVVKAGNIYFAKKLRLFWHRRDSVNIVAVGSSPLHFGFNPAGMSIPTLNISSYGSDLVTDAVIIRDYVLPHTPGLTAIVLDLTVGFLNQDGLLLPSLLDRLDGLYVSKGYGLDSAYNFYRSGLPQQVVDKSAAFTKETDWPGIDSRGFEEALLGLPGAGWGVPQIDRGDYDINDSVVRKNLGLLAALGDMAAAKGVHLIIVHMPENPRYDTTNSIGRYGPGRTTYVKVVAWIDTLVQNNSYVHFYNANNYGSHDFADSEALDCNHLNYLGAQRMAAKIDSVVRLYVP
jgi:formylglycine-generating enzyme required for sulfatase activity